ncbi:MAG TPA: metalloregulator ArsR/SmtB family transcription factor [Nitrospinota bacterium]|jgi:ArsR family transcriptional regulator|nr:metalloregulator ArsR/SmtB family transcription factor [Nitrospinota bacterium]|tara:strand:+ start:30550 stop:30894 length:345 start_codon:yes stop_codon:yes gene_type:complete
MTPDEKKVYELHASICQILANPKRLQIINTLRDKELSAGDLGSRLNISKSNLSQHLALLRDRGIVTNRRDGVTIYYRISNPKILKAFDIMRQILFEQVRESERLVKKYAIAGKK